VKLFLNPVALEITTLKFCALYQNFEKLMALIYFSGDWMSGKEVGFDQLENADLIVDAVYKGGYVQNFGADPLNKLIGCGNQGGFRPRVNLGSHRELLVVLYSTLVDTDWPDNIDNETGIFTYYGDNKNPGHELHDTPKGGNRLLRKSFESYHGSADRRKEVPPFFIFTKGVLGRDVVFKGLAAPGTQGNNPTEDLVAIWKSKQGERFQNYRAFFTILNVPVISRKWINDIVASNILSENCPNEWRLWVEHGRFRPLNAESTISYRNREKQMPQTLIGNQIINIIHNYFRNNPYMFEHCAAEIAKLMDSNIVSIDVTRPWRDGGRDAVGFYRIGTSEDNIKVEFALEAKCFGLNNSCGIKLTSRLLSRLKYRQFGIFVTTSFVSLQPYKEIREDKHPIIIISGADIVKILFKTGLNTPKKVQEWLTEKFPLA
jgi:hypothetical protein